MTDTEWLLRGVALVEAALRPTPLLSAQGNLLPLVTDLGGEPPLMLVVAVLSALSLSARIMDPAELHAALDSVRQNALGPDPTR